MNKVLWTKRRSWCLWPSEDCDLSLTHLSACVNPARALLLHMTRVLSPGDIHRYSRDDSQQLANESLKSRLQAVVSQFMCFGGVALTKGLLGGGGMYRLYVFKVKPAFTSFFRITNPSFMKRSVQIPCFKTSLHKQKATRSTGFSFSQKCFTYWSVLIDQVKNGDMIVNFTLSPGLVVCISMVSTTYISISDLMSFVYFWVEYIDMLCQREMVFFVVIKVMLCCRCPTLHFRQYQRHFAIRSSLSFSKVNTPPTTGTLPRLSYSL